MFKVASTVCSAFLCFWLFISPPHEQKKKKGISTATIQVEKENFWAEELNDPNCSPVRKAIGLASQKKKTEMLSAIETAKDDFNFWEDNHLNVLIEYMNNAEYFEEAHKLLDEALNQKDLSGHRTTTYQGTLARLLLRKDYKNRNPARALELARKASIGTNPPTESTLLAQALIANQEFPQAKEVLEKVLFQNPSICGVEREEIEQLLAGL